MSVHDIIQAAAGIGTTAGVIVAAVQLWLSRQQERSAFEDSLAREYRHLSQRIPIAAMLGDFLDDDDIDQSLPEFFHYFTLTNDQIYLLSRRRISTDEWADWNAGMRDNLSRPAFHSAWEKLKKRGPSSFTELRRLEADNFATDPADWV